MSIFFSRRRVMQALAAGAITPVAAMQGCDSRQSTTSLAMQASWVNDAEFIGYFVAMQQGFYKAADLDFHYQQGGPEIVSETVLLARRADVALTTPDTTINAIVKNGVPLRIIGTQYQKSPLGIVSLRESHINKPSDLAGKTVAVPPANVLTINAFLELNKVPKDAVRIVPYQYDPTPLIRGEVDATLDFVTNVPFTIRQQNREPSSFLLYDFGFRLFNDTVVVLEETLKNKRPQLVAWLRASRQGWEENFKDTSRYPAAFSGSFFKGNGRTIANEAYYNHAQMPLIQSPNGIFSMSDDAIAQNVESLNRVGIRASRDMFVSDLLREL